MAKADTIIGSPIPDSAARLDAPGSTRGNDRAAEQARLKELAQEFEAMLMNEMLADWRRSLAGDDQADDAGGFGTITDMVGGEFGRALSRAGGIGIAEVLMRSFERQQPLERQQQSPEPPAGSADSTSPALAPIKSQTVHGQPAHADLIHPGDPATAKITSPYGWRSDPFSGQSRFHGGLDMRMAYGQPVASMAPGRVSFAGEQGGYGLTVVVDHGNGLQTRYAHLASTDVQVGDEVGRGQAIARSGNSGRSTAPHLHLEVLRHGRTIDPAGLLKSGGDRADWTAYQTPLAERHGGSS